MTFRTALLAAVALTVPAAGAQAATVAALAGDNTLVMIDTAAKKASAPVKITGVTGNIVGIDVRPSDGMLYGVVADGTVVTIDKAGKATMKSKLQTMLPAGATATIDFNPAADRLRLMGSDGTSLRANVDDGMVTKDGSHKFADADEAKGQTPNVVAGAYTNSFKGTKETTLLNIDGSLGALLRQAPPNDGVLNTLGKLGVAAKTASFDIESDGKGGNTGWLLTGGTLYNVNLTSGATTSVGAIAGAPANIRDIAVLPAM